MKRNINQIHDLIVCKRDNANKDAIYHQAEMKKYAMGDSRYKNHFEGYLLCLGNAGAYNDILFLIESSDILGGNENDTSKW